MANNQKKYAGLDALQTFLENIKAKFSQIGHKHTLSDISDYTVDSALSSTSSNPVANSTLDAEFNAVSQAMGALEQAIDGKADSAHNHNDLYYTQNQLDIKFASKSDSTHNHDSNYADINHNHDDVYSLSDHNHDAKYDSKGTASSAVSIHNTSTSAHNDIRDLITGLTNRLNALADSDDITLDQLSEIITYIKSNKSLIDSITTTKVNVSDIIDNLETNISNKPLSAAQGVAIKSLIDALQLGLDEIVTEGAVILPATNITVNVNSSGKGQYMTFGDGYSYNEDIVIGSVYDVEYDGNKYTCTAVTGLSYDNQTFAQGACLGGINEGYPFIIANVSGKFSSLSALITIGESVAATQAGTATHTIKINKPTTINPELIPSTLATKDDVNAISNACVAKADLNWTQIYDSGETTESVNAFANINISGYKKLMVVAKCVNDGTNSTSKNGSVTFTAINGTKYQFPCWTTMFTNAAYTSGGMATFEINDGWLICPNATRILKSSNFLGSEGGTADNLNNTGSGIMKCTNELSTMMVSALDQDTNYYFLAGSRVIVWGCKA